MAITITSSVTYDGSFLGSHTISAFDCSGTDSFLFVAGFNKNPAVEVTSVTADANAMTLIDDNINANVVAIQAYGYEINNSSFNIVANTPTFKEWAGIAIALAGVDQTTNYNTVVSEIGGFGNTATTTITGTAGSLILIIGATQGDQTLTISGTGATVEENFSPASGIGTCILGYATATGSSQTLGFTSGANDNYRLTLVEIYATPAQPPVVAWLTA